MPHAANAHILQEHAQSVMLTTNQQPLDLLVWHVLMVSSVLLEIQLVKSVMYLVMGAMDQLQDV